ncbi:uncharacterized protein LOC124653950 [Lolium rigidum]|uniref:uncharacterized protein LOC124653950 n=1 Tax=Lolium rigidum TaxID=89674 RepID=UPI001F5CF9B4|nr:uncharacterized protein LOC124653950 [Lolium rigidum]
MGLLELKRLMATQRHRRQIQARDGSIASRVKRKGSPCERNSVLDESIASRAKRKGLPCQKDFSPQGASWYKTKGLPCAQGFVADGSVVSLADRKSSSCQQCGSSQSCEVYVYSGPSLPEDIWRYIHSLMSMRDAARAACISRAFRCSWRYHPNLVFSKKTLGLNGKTCGNDKPARDYASIVDHILKNHSGTGVKKLKFWNAPHYTEEDRYYLDSWLEMAVKPGIEEFTFSLESKSYSYNFPCPLISDGNGELIRDLQLHFCVFVPTVGFGCFRSLTSLDMFKVRITGNDLERILSNSFALERLLLRYCIGLLYVKMPSLLERLSYLKVLSCSKLQVIESRAPNLSSFIFQGTHQAQLSLGESSQLKYLYISFLGAVHYTRAELASSMPYLETAFIYSSREMVNTPIESSRFLHLKHLSITITEVNSSPSYDYCSLVSFFDASPSLETFYLDVPQQHKKHVTVFGDSSELRQLPKRNHEKLREVKILGFSPVKSLVELTCHILGSATSLECLTLDTKRHGLPGCSVNKVGRCTSMERDMISEAQRALSAVQVYIKPKVPSTVKLHALGPCSRFHGIGVTHESMWGIKPKVPSAVKLHALEPCSTYEAMWAMLYGPNFHAMAGLSQDTLEAPARQT